jgi:hypothetical protein
MSVPRSSVQGLLLAALVPAGAIHRTRSTATLRINAIPIFLSDMSKGRIARFACRGEFSSSSQDSCVCNRYGEKPELGSWSTTAACPERRHRDHAASHQVLQRPAQLDVQLHRTPSLPAALVVWTCQAHIKDDLQNSQTGKSHQSFVCRLGSMVIQVNTYHGSVDRQHPDVY